ncbi:MAG: cyclic 2,3-diphosphoglycerate synthase [Acidobacteriota bacterium]|nr:cyclic 2,3-diphosphoglycerate synthase [Acidobacteriota bacterium]MDQ7088502.1 cyclic 2,3-diphosphoglycerate synthase [Acidobacteriota bacterium]
MAQRRIIIAGAAGRDFHNFNVALRGRTDLRVVAFTATQIPDIDGRVYPAELAGADYPEGIPIRDEADLEQLIAESKADEVIHAYSDVAHETVMHLASRVLAAGADFRILGPAATEIRSSKPVISVCAVRTGCGKSQTSRKIARLLREGGRRVAVIRHPMPYGDLAAQRCQRFATLEDMDRHKCTIEEREEYEPHVAVGNLVFAGVDYEEILRRAEQEADVILWDGGNNDLPFYVPDLHIVVVDPLRPGHEELYHPGEANARKADVFVINKIDSADEDAVARVEANLRRLNPRARVIRAASPVVLEEGAELAGKRVLVIEDGPTLTHGGMKFGAGVVVARQAGVVEIVDPRPWAVGSIAATYAKYPETGAVLPAMGYSDQQVADLQQTLEAAASAVDAYVIGTPIDLRRLMDFPKPAVRATYSLEEKGPLDLAEVLGDFL